MKANKYLYLIALSFFSILVFASCSDDEDNNPITDNEDPIERGELKMTIMGTDWSPPETTFIPTVEQGIFSTEIKFSTPFIFNLLLDSDDIKAGAFDLSTKNSSITIEGPLGDDSVKYYSDEGTINITDVTDSTIAGTFNGLVLNDINNTGKSITLNNGEFDLDIE